MAKRPALTDKSFLGYLFSPKRNPLPTGLRKVTLKGLKGGRSKARVNAFNRMSPASQETLRRSGLRDAYLSGNASLADAKNLLRPQAIALNVARPSRTRTSPGNAVRTGLDGLVGEHLKRVLRSEGRPVSSSAVDANVVWLGGDASEDMLSWRYPEIRYAARNGSEYERVDDKGVVRNPFWYH